jgi:hypothetical protein
VGSATRTKKWRDVDVSMIMSDEAFRDLFGDIDESRAQYDRKWSSMMTAFSLYAERATGLPVDFKMQSTTYANEKHDGWRNALGLFFLPRQKPAIGYREDEAT